MLGRGFRPRLTSIAEIDLAEAIIYFESEKEGFGQIFLDDFRDTLEKLSRFWAKEIKYDRIRTVKVGRFSYLIHYQINEEVEEILIVTILHARSDYKNRL